MEYNLRVATATFSPFMAEPEPRWIVAVEHDSKIVRWFAFRSRGQGDDTLRKLSSRLALGANLDKTFPAGTAGNGYDESSMRNRYKNIHFIDEENKSMSTINRNLRRGTGYYQGNRARWFILDDSTGRWYSFGSKESAGKAMENFDKARRLSLNDGSRGVDGINEAGYTVLGWENEMTTDELWALIGKAANEHNLCPQYDAFAKEHGGPPRPPKMRRKRIIIGFPVDFDVPEDMDPDKYWDSMQPSDKVKAVQERINRITSVGRGIVPGDFLYDRAVKR